MPFDTSPRIPHCTACGEKPRSAEDVHECDGMLFCPDCIDQAREDSDFDHAVKQFEERMSGVIEANQ